jgi:hypothetical protein
LAVTLNLLDIKLLRLSRMDGAVIPVTVLLSTDVDVSDAWANAGEVTSSEPAKANAAAPKPMKVR